MSLANASVLRKSLRIFQIYGANTDVGKTICSTVLCQGLNHYRPKDSIWYLKPVSTGPLNEADTGHINRFVGSVRTKCLYQFDQAVSPHIASQSAVGFPSLPCRFSLPRSIDLLLLSGALYVGLCS